MPSKTLRFAQLFKVVRHTNHTPLDQTIAEENAFRVEVSKDYVLLVQVSDCSCHLPENAHLLLKIEGLLDEILPGS